MSGSAQCTATVFPCSQHLCTLVSAPPTSSPPRAQPSPLYLDLLKEVDFVLLLNQLLLLLSVWQKERVGSGSVALGPTIPLPT